MADKITIERDALIRALAHLEVIVPSLDRIGSAAADVSKEEHHQVVSEFIYEWDVGRRLSEVRKILSDLIDYDELERLFGDIQTWKFNQRKPKV